MLSVEMYTGWTRYIGPTVRGIGATCFSCKCMSMLGGSVRTFGV